MFKYALLGVLAIAVIGCSSDKASTDTTSSTGSTATTGSTTQSSSTTGSSAAATSPNPDYASVQISTVSTGVGQPPKDGQDIAIINTNQGRIVVKFFPDKAPNHVKNFISLANQGFYEKSQFHRVIQGFMIQGGDPNSKDSDPSDDGQGGPGYSVPAEFNDIHHGPGILSMARSSDPNSAGSQFFIMVADNAGLDNQYTAFGEVVEGMDVVNKIVNLPTDGEHPKADNPAIIESVKVEKWPLKG